MKNKLPEFKRPEPVLTGPASEAKRTEYKKMYSDNFGEKHEAQFPENKRYILKALEYEKKPYEDRAIELGNKITNALLEKFDLQPFDIPKRNFHIVPERLYKEVEEGQSAVAITFQRKQMVVINAEKVLGSINRVKIILHEMIHLKAFLSIDAHEDAHRERRGGLRIYGSKIKGEDMGSFYAFSGLNEAAVEEMAKKNFTELIRGNEFLKDEYEWEQSQQAQDFKEKKAKKVEIDVAEIISVTRDGNDFDSFSYYWQRRVLYYIVDRLFADNSDKYKSRDEVMNLFFKAHFDGKIVSLARLIEKSFGAGAFRMIGMMDDDKNSARQVMDFLKKHKKSDK